ncbi:hypothetical protein [Herbaspirillum autotrophicum]|uniref:hypothetical protein n=1 Tax=Herbaspirillum autotrophicum TaxID=180195 RepID=UPI00067A8250|nr:hypothetical protein [Herbaspirillum autotrophicum]
MITSIINAAAAVLTSKTPPVAPQAVLPSAPMQKAVTDPVRRKCKRDWLGDAMQCEEHAAPA